MREFTSPQSPGRHLHSVILQARSRLRTAEVIPAGASGIRPICFLSEFSTIRSYRGAPMSIAIERRDVELPHRCGAAVHGVPNNY